MNRGELIHRIGTLALLFGMLYLFGSSLMPLDLGKRQAIGFGLIASFIIRYLYIMVRDGWDAAEETADRDGGPILTTVIVAAAIVHLF